MYFDRFHLLKRLLSSKCSMPSVRTFVDNKKQDLFVQVQSSSSKKPRVLSGVQPTGNLHIGNYLGSIDQWVDLQNLHECFFCVVDLHAITPETSLPDLNINTLNSVATFISCGIDPEKSTIFVQSHVPQHAELSWILQCVTPLGNLGRMTQFKDKSRHTDELSSVNAGLMLYPVLMAADILLYQAELVPVGDDQTQHVELTRDIAHKFTLKYPSYSFVQPSVMLSSSSSRIMSLNDPTVKMSKSSANDSSRINMTDAPDVIVKKIKRAKSDSLDSSRGFEWDNPNRPESSSLLSLYKATSKMSKRDIDEQMMGKDWNYFKSALADVIVERLRPIQAEMHRLASNKNHLEKIVKAGRERAFDEAESTMKWVRKAVGLLPR